MKHLFLILSVLTAGFSARAAQDGCYALIHKNSTVIADAGIFCVTGFGPEGGIPLLKVATLDNGSDVKYCGKSVVFTRMSKTNPEEYSIQLGPRLVLEVDVKTEERSGLRKGEISFTENGKKTAHAAVEIRADERIGTVWNSAICTGAPVFSTNEVALRPYFHKTASELNRSFKDLPVLRLKDIPVGEATRGSGLCKTAFDNKAIPSKLSFARPNGESTPRIHSRRLERVGYLTDQFLDVFYKNILNVSKEAGPDAFPWLLAGAFPEGVSLSGTPLIRALERAFQNGSLEDRFINPERTQSRLMHLIQHPSLAGGRAVSYHVEDDNVPAEGGGYTPEWYILRTEYRTLPGGAGYISSEESLRVPHTVFSKDHPVSELETLFASGKGEHEASCVWTREKENL